MTVTQLGSVLGAVIGSLVALAIAGLTPWFLPVTAFIVWVLLNGLLTRILQRTICDRCDKGHPVALRLYDGERLCVSCRDQIVRDDRLDGLVKRATATVEDLYHRDADWPNDEETEEMEIRLRALGPDVELAWRAYLRAATASNEKQTAEARARRVEARDALLLAIQSARQIRHR